MDEIDIENRLTKVEERSKSNTHQINDLKPVVNEIHQLSQTLVVLVEQVKGTNENVAKLTDKVEEVEQQPAKQWTSTKRALWNAFLVAVGSTITMACMYEIAQYIVR